MTTLGGAAVAKVARLAGFHGDAIKQAQVVSYAATRWNDAYQWDVPGAPTLDQWGLFATWPNRDYDGNPRDLFKAQCSADDAYRLWSAAGQTWDWHPVVQAQGGSLIRGAYRLIEEHRLWSSSTRAHTAVAVPFGHPEGTRPPRLFGTTT